MLLVMLFHANVPGFSGGFLGVDVFFVLSGYLITRVLAETHREHPLRHFYERRARRLLPALTVVCLATAALSTIVLVPRLLHGVGTQLTATALFAANLQHARVAGYFSPSATESPLLHMWSLAVEEQFYLFFPVVLLLSLQRSPHLTRWLVGGLTASSLGLAVVLEQGQPSLAFYLTPARAWELGIGAMLALGMAPDLRTTTARSAATATGLVAIGASTTGLFSPSLVPPALLTVLGTAALIHAESRGPTPLGGWLRWDPLRHVGRISYGLYLWHWPLLVLTQALLWRGLSLPIWAALAVLGVAMLLAQASWQLIEQPLLRSQHRPAQVAGAAALSMALVATLGLVLRIDEGLPQRFSPETQQLADAAADANAEMLACAASPSTEVCRYGPARPPDLFVWGDSHATALLPAIIEAAGPDASIHAVTQQGCGPFLGYRRASVSEADAERCHRSNAALVEAVRRRPGATVLLHARWAAYAEGTLVSSNVPWRLVSEDQRQPEPFSLTSSVAALEAEGARIVVLTGVPEPPMRVPEHLVASAVLGWAPLALPTASHIARNEGVQRALDELGSRVTVIDLTPALCAESCPVVRDGIPVYRDADHLTETAARTVIAPHLAPTLSGLVHRAESTGDPGRHPTPDRRAHPSR